ncbi:MAG: RDD family protein [Burkholderiales bacterium]|nr:RDD family protein [Burkholderiales bacterium]
MLHLLDTVRSIPTPEGIELTLHLAGPVPRAVAWLTDFLLRLGVLLAAAWVLGMLGAFGWSAILILAFLLEWLAMAAFEVWADGATPGKRALGLMVLHDDGTPVGWPAALVRNLLRAVDFLPAAYGFGLAAMLLNGSFKRLGDIAAGTVVVYREPGERAAAIPLAPPVPAPRPLDLDEQRAVMDFAERSALLTPERAQEIAALTTALTGAPAGREHQRLTEIANHLSGRRA